MNTAIKTDTWEEIVDIGIELAQATDRNRWAMGELAVRAERKYGDGCIGKLAYAINVRTKTLYDYHRVSAFYGQYSAHAENLSWSHYREALRIGDLDRALWALEKASSRDWRVEKFSAILSRYLGKNKHDRTQSGHNSDNEPLVLAEAVAWINPTGDYLYLDGQPETHRILRDFFKQSVANKQYGKVKITISAIEAG